mgnify:CR=1 FL=1
MKIQKWKTLKSHIILNHKWVKVRQDQIELPNGKIIDDYFVYPRPDIVLILAITENKEIILVRQYRHGVEKILLELPGGTFNPAEETGELAAQRELEEETGYIADRLMPLTTFYDNPVKDTNKIHVFIAENAQALGKQNLDITEDIEIILVPIAAIMEKIATGDIIVSGSIAAICLGLKFLSYY